MTKTIDFQAEATALQNQLISWRRSLHQIPETGIRLPLGAAIYARTAFDYLSQV